MTCTDYKELVSDYVDGTLELGAQAKIEQHLSNCDGCRAVRDDLLQIVHFSHQLPLHTPSTMVWSRIQEDLVEERKLVGFWTSLTSRFRSLDGRFLGFTTPQIAAVAASIVVAVSAAIYWTGLNQPGSLQNNFAGAPTTNRLSNGEIAQADLDDIQRIESRIENLTETVELRKAAWSPELRASFDRNMAHLDQTILESRQQWRTNPGDGFCRELLLNAYYEKRRLLESFEKF